MIMGDHNSDTEDEEDDTTTNFVNDITLNFLMNKNHHKKYISKTNPEEHQREQKHQSSLRKYKNKIINMHPALLPSFPGLDSQKQALDYGAKYSGCTVHFVDSGMDTGPVIIQAVVEIKEKDNGRISSSQY